MAEAGSFEAPPERADRVPSQQTDTMASIGPPRVSGQDWYADTPGESSGPTDTSTSEERTSELRRAALGLPEPTAHRSGDVAPPSTGSNTSGSQDVSHNVGLLGRAGMSQSVPPEAPSQAPATIPHVDAPSSPMLDDTTGDAEALARQLLGTAEAVDGGDELVFRIEPREEDEPARQSQAGTPIPDFFGADLDIATQPGPRPFSAASVTTDDDGGWAGEDEEEWTGIREGSVL